MKIEYPDWVRTAAKEMFIAHMREHGHGGDDWDQLPGHVQLEWMARAEREQRRLDDAVDEDCS